MKLDVTTREEVIRKFGVENVPPFAGGKAIDNAFPSCDWFKDRTDWRSIDEIAQMYNISESNKKKYVKAYAHVFEKLNNN